MTETPNETDERRARAALIWDSGERLEDKSTYYKNELFSLTRAIRASDEAAGMVLVPREEWTAGAPSHFAGEDWFLAVTTYGDPVVLKSLPREWTYDFKTADETYIMANKIRKWRSLPDDWEAMIAAKENP